MPRLVTVSACSLNQWALDWSGNLDRITDSIRKSKDAGAGLRVGPELEICGSDCLDSFFEDDLYLHSWEMLGRILADKECHGIILCIGMPVKHNGKRYNCNVFALNGKILLIAPRTVPWSDQNIRDGRYFSLWENEGAVEEHIIPEFLRDIHGSFVSGQFSDEKTEPLSHASFRLGPPSTMSTFVDMVSDSFLEALPKVYFTEAEEIALGPICWLWDYIRRSGMAGFLVSLSGGIDSCSTAIVVYTMCHLIMNAIGSGNHVVIKDVQRICATTDRNPHWLPATAHELCNSLLHTLYMGMPQQSSEGSRRRSQALQKSIGSYHLDLNIEEGYNAQKNLIIRATGHCPKFQVFGGSNPEDLCLQNIQARLRMVKAYQFGQILPVSRGRVSQAGLLVLSSTNADEALRGNYTRYDCSSADLNPIGSFSKNHLRLMITWARQYFQLPILQSFLDAKPSGELQPITEDYSQNDEQDLGLGYDELAAFAKSRKDDRLGPVSMFQKHLQNWAGEHSPKEIASKVKNFHHFATLNRYKTTTLTPAYHATSYSPHNNWCDFRQFLYPAQNHGHPFQRIDHLADTAENRATDDNITGSAVMAKL